MDPTIELGNLKFLQEYLNHNLKIATEELNNLTCASAHMSILGMVGAIRVISVYSREVTDITRAIEYVSTRITEVEAVINANT